MLTPGTGKTFGEYTIEVFVPLDLSQYKSATRLDLPESLKSMTRENRDKRVRRRVGTVVAVPGQRQNCLRVDENKTELFSFLSSEIIKSVKDQSKELIVTLEIEVITAPPRMNLKSLAPCIHEETDGCMFLYAADAAHRGNDMILIRTVDTYVVVFAAQNFFEDMVSLWNREKLAIHLCT
jgi:hypothetical protein